MNLPLYLAEYSRLLANPEVPALLHRLEERITTARAAGGKILLAGNGASASIASDPEYHARHSPAARDD